MLDNRKLGELPEINGKLVKVKENLQLCVRVVSWLSEILFGWNKVTFLRSLEKYLCVFGYLVL